VDAGTSEVLSAVVAQESLVSAVDSSHSIRRTLEGFCVLSGKAQKGPLRPV
jgi:hypothetical protein